MRALLKRADQSLRRFGLTVQRGAGLLEQRRQMVFQIAIADSDALCRGMQRRAGL